MGVFFIRNIGILFPWNFIKVKVLSSHLITILRTVSKHNCEVISVILQEQRVECILKLKKRLRELEIDNNADGLFLGGVFFNSSNFLVILIR